LSTRWIFIFVIQFAHDEAKGGETSTIGKPEGAKGFGPLEPPKKRFALAFTKPYGQEEGGWGQKGRRKGGKPTRSFNHSTIPLIPHLIDVERKEDFQA